MVSRMKCEEETNIHTIKDVEFLAILFGEPVHNKRY